MKPFITLAVMVSLIMGTFSPVVAEMIPDVTYAGGHPDIQTDKIKNGELNILSDRIEFSISGSEGVKIPYSLIERVYVVDNPTGRPFLKTTVIAASVLAAGILSAPAFAILGAKKHVYFLSVDFKDDMDVAHTASFRMRGETALRAKASMDSAMDKFKRVPVAKSVEKAKPANATQPVINQPQMTDSKEQSTPQYLQKYL